MSPRSDYRANVETILDDLLGRLPPDRLLVVTTPDYTVTPAGADYGDPATGGRRSSRNNAILTEVATRARDRGRRHLRPLRAGRRRPNARRRRMASTRRAPSTPVGRPDRAGRRPTPRRRSSAEWLTKRRSWTSYDAIPKVELHCHVEGSVRPRPSSRWPAGPAETSPDRIRRNSYRYTSLDAFLAVFWLVQETLAGPADWERVAYESLVDGASHGLRYREMFFTPARHLATGQSLAGIVDGLTAGIEAAEASAGVRCMLIADMDRAYGPAAGGDLVELLAQLRRTGRAERVIGVGMDSTELGVDLAAFAGPFELARRHGFRCTGHAGEAVGVGPENIRIALDQLGVERIDHGVAVAEDPVLAERMVAEAIPLTVCPTSNVVIANRFEDLSEHPFRAMREAGLLVTSTRTIRG